MLSPEYIEEQSCRAARLAAKRNMKPFVVWPEDLRKWKEKPSFPFPFLGSYVPKGYKLIKKHFVDSSGFGSPNEPALTAKQFVDLMREGDMLGITEVGQFQVYVGQYIKVGKKNR